MKSKELLKLGLIFSFLGSLMLLFAFEYKTSERTSTDGLIDSNGVVISEIKPTQVIPKPLFYYGGIIFLIIGFGLQLKSINKDENLQ